MSHEYLNYRLEIYQLRFKNFGKLEIKINVIQKCHKNRQMKTKQVLSVTFSRLFFKNAPHFKLNVLRWCSCQR